MTNLIACSFVDGVRAHVLRDARQRWIPAIALIGMLAASSSAGAAAYEGFDYPVGPQSTFWKGGSGFVDGNTPGVTPNGWFTGGSALPGSLADPTGTLAVSGNRIQVANDTRRRLAETMGTPGTDVWISWLQRRSQNGIGFQGLGLLRPSDGSGSGGVYFFIGEPGIGPGNDTYVIGAGGDDFNVVSSGVPVVPNETAFLVAHLQFREGKDLATLYVNPTPGAAAPTGGVTYSGVDMPVFNPIAWFQGTANDQRITHEFDELRVGDSYAAIAPVPEPTTAAWLIVAMALLARQHPSALLVRPR